MSNLAWSEGGRYNNDGPRPACMQFTGHSVGLENSQRRCRTADLPLFRSWDNSSLNTVIVRDLCGCIDLNTNEP
jgi:hypothetical protein